MRLVSYQSHGVLDEYKYDKDLLDYVHNKALFTSSVRPLDSLRERGHPFSLPDFNTNIHKKSFVVSTLYKFM